MNKNKKKMLIVILSIIIVIGIICACIFLKKPANNPEDVLKTYMSYILDKNYEGMYELISEETKKNTEKET